MEDVRVRLAGESPDLVQRLDRAIAEAHRTGKVQMLDAVIGVYSKHQPLIVRKKGLDDGTAEGPWPAFFARMYALVGPGLAAWGEIGVVSTYPPGESSVGGRVLSRRGWRSAGARPRR